MEYVIVDDGCVRIDHIMCANIDRTLHQTTVTLTDGSTHTATGFAHLNVLFAIQPTSLEGQREIKWVKRAWMLHNIIGHPLMQIFALVGCYRIAMWFHDKTVPRPVGIKRSGNAS